MRQKDAELMRNFAQDVLSRIEVKMRLTSFMLNELEYEYDEVIERMEAFDRLLDEISCHSLELLVTDEDASVLSAARIILPKPLRVKGKDDQ